MTKSDIRGQELVFRLRDGEINIFVWSTAADGLVRLVELFISATKAAGGTVSVKRKVEEEL